jgi:hypothetical protein
MHVALQDEFLVCFLTGNTSAHIFRTPDLREGGAVVLTSYYCGTPQHRALMKKQRGISVCRFFINNGDNTISPVNAMHLVLGVAPGSNIPLCQAAPGADDLDPQKERPRGTIEFLGLWNDDPELYHRETKPILMPASVPIIGMSDGKYAYHEAAIKSLMLELSYQCLDSGIVAFCADPAKPAKWVSRPLDDWKGRGPCPEGTPIQRIPESEHIKFDSLRGDFDIIPGPKQMHRITLDDIDDAEYDTSSPVLAVATASAVTAAAPSAVKVTAPSASAHAFCPYCGFKGPSKFCGGCGAKQPL